MNNQLIKHYQGGRGLPVFRGSQRYRQSGAGFLGALVKMALPILGSIGSSLFNITGRTAKDVISSDKPLGESIIDNTLHEVKSKIIGPRKRVSKFAKTYKQSTNKRIRKH